MKLFKTKNTDCRSEPIGRGIHGRKTRPLNQTNQNGRSMVEMLGVLAIIGVLSIGGIAGYRYAMQQIGFNEMLYLTDRFILATVTEGNSNYSIFQEAKDAGGSISTVESAKVLSDLGQYLCKNYFGEKYCQTVSTELGANNRRYGYVLSGNKWWFVNPKNLFGGAINFGPITHEQCHQMVDLIFSKYPDNVSYCGYHHWQPSSGTQEEKCRAMCDDACHPNYIGVTFAFKPSLKTTE